MKDSTRTLPKQNYDTSASGSSQVRLCWQIGIKTGRPSEAGQGALVPRVPQPSDIIHSKGEPLIGDTYVRLIHFLSLHLRVHTLRLTDFNQPEEIYGSITS